MDLGCVDMDLGQLAEDVWRDFLRWFGEFG
jgi:hypothetical protein